MGARWSVFLLVSVVVIGSVSSAQAGEWGETCQQYFTSVERFCEVANAIPKFADKCETVQRAVADMKALADEVDPMRVEEVCVTANASLLMTIEALERSPSLAKASAAKASVIPASAPIASNSSPTHGSVVRWLRRHVTRRCDTRRAWRPRSR